MSPVEPCALSDVEEVARLHAKLFQPSASHSRLGLEKYYRETFFEHPWVDQQITPLVSREKGRITGFLGVIPRPMRLYGERVRLAVLHRGMVDPATATPFTARAILQAFIEGPQDLSVSDSASSTARELWESMGKDVVLTSSIDWAKGIRPFGFNAHLLGRRSRLRPFVKLSRPVFALGDWILHTLGRSCDSIETSIELRETSDDQLLDALTDLTSTRPINPEYTPETWSWLMGRLRGNESRGRFETRLATDSKDRVHGVCAWYVRSDRTMEVLLLAMRPRRRDAVLGALFLHAWRSGQVAVKGRLDRQVMQSSWIRGCRLEQHLWTLMHSSDPRLPPLFHRGDAMGSGLDYENWVPYPAAEFGSWPA